MKRFDIEPDKILNILLILIASLGIYMCGWISGGLYASDLIEPVVVTEYVYVEVEPLKTLIHSEQAPQNTVSEAVEPAESTNENLVEYFDVPLSEEIQDHIFEVCETYGMDASVVVAMIDRESKYDISAVGDSGRSFGLMQIQKRWHVERMVDLGCDDLLDPYQNVTVGVDYLAELMAKNRGIEWALMAYNGGPSYANKQRAAGKVSSYAREVLSNAESLEVGE